jgi:hypothetical protein
VIAYTVLTFIIMVIYGCQNYLIRSNNVVSQRAFVSVAFRPGVSAWGPATSKITKEGILEAVTHGYTATAVTFITDISNSGNTGTKSLSFFTKCAASPEDLQEPWSILYQGKNNPARSPQFIGPHATSQTFCSFGIDQIKAIREASALTM